MPKNKDDYIECGSFLLTPKQYNNLLTFTGFHKSQIVKLLKDTVNKKISKGSICIINHVIRNCRLSDHLYYVVMYDTCDPELEELDEMLIEDLICITDITDKLD